MTSSWGRIEQTKGAAAWLFLKTSKFQKTRVAQVEVSLSVVSVGIRQKSKTSTRLQFRVPVKLQLFFFMAILVRRIPVDGIC